MTKGALVRTLAEQHELKGKVASGIIDSLAAGNHRGQEDWHLHHPRPLQNQDSRQARHQGRNQADVWKGGQGQGSSSQDCCEGFPSCCTQGSDLSILQITQGGLHSMPETDTRGNPMSRFGCWLIGQCTLAETLLP